MSSVNQSCVNVIDEFAKRLKEELNNTIRMDGVRNYEIIDNLVKEFKGSDKKEVKQ